MYIQSRNYQLKTYNKDLFVQLHKHDFPITFSQGIDSKITFSSRQDLYLKSNKKVKKISEFPSSISCLEVNKDYICAGSKSGDLRLFSDRGKSLRNYSEHTAPVNDIKLSLDNNIVISCSDDCKLKFYKMDEEVSFKTIEQNDGYIKCLGIDEKNLYVGSKTLKIYSLDTYDLKYAYNHGKTISKVIILGNGKVVFASANQIHLLDKDKNELENTVIFPKNVSKLIYFGGMIYTSSLDGHFKTFTSSLELINDFTVKGQILDLSLNTEKVFITLDNSTIMGLPDIKDKAATPISSGPVRPKYEDDIEYQTIENTKRNCTEVEQLLRKFEYKNCLRLIFTKKDIETSYYILKTIQESRQLMRAIKDEKEPFVEQFLLFCIDHFRIQEFSSILIESLYIITAIYSDLILENPRLKELIAILSDVVNEEYIFQQNCTKVCSFLECFENY